MIVGSLKLIAYSEVADYGIITLEFAESLLAIDRDTGASAISRHINIPAGRLGLLYVTYLPK